MKKIIKTLFVVLLCIIIGALIIRTIIYSDKSVWDDFEITDASRAAYAESGELSVLEMTYKNRTADNGYFCAYSMYYVEETGELQVTVRFNVSALDYTDTESEENIEFLLMKRVGEDLSAEGVTQSGSSSSLSEMERKQNILENYTGEYFRPTRVEEKSRYGIYRYRKLFFENIELDGENEDVIVVMAPTGTELPDENADSLERYDVYKHFMDRQYMHYTAQPYDTHSLTRREISELTK